MQVLQNIETYLVEEEVRMIAQDKKWKEYQVKENLKEMGDVSSGMASTVIQIYLASVLDSFIHPSVQVRKLQYNPLQPQFVEVLRGCALIGLDHDDVL